jgi:hypothetical protein
MTVTAYAAAAPDGLGAGLTERAIARRSSPGSLHLAGIEPLVQEKEIVIDRGEIALAFGPDDLPCRGARFG